MPCVVLQILENRVLGPFLYCAGDSGLVELAGVVKFSKLVL